MNPINIMAPVNPLGYGVVGLNIVKELSKSSSVYLFPIGNPELTTQEDATIIQECIKNQSTFDPKAPCLRVWHQHAMAEQIGNGLRCGLPIFELDKFNDVEQHNLHSLDRIFVCSQWAKNVVLDNVKIPHNKVHVIPLGVNSDLFNKLDASYEPKVSTIYLKSITSLSTNAALTPPLENASKQP